MNKLQLDDFLPYHLVVSADLISRSLSKIYSKYGLTAPEWRIIAHLQASEGLTPSDIGYLSNMEKARVSRALALMSKKGLIVRTVDDSDKRVSHIVLSESGHQLFLKIESEVLRWNTRFSDKLGREVYRNLLGALKDIQINCRDESYFS